MGPTQVELNELPGAIRERLTRAANIEAEPFPVHQTPELDFLGVKIMAGLVALFGLGLAGWWLSEDWWDVGGIVTCLVPATFCIVGGAGYLVRERLKTRTLPFPRGVYLFATDVVDARQPRLKILSVGDMRVQLVKLVESRSREVRGRVVEVLAGDERMMVLGRTQGEPDELARELHELKGAWHRNEIRDEDDIFREARGADRRVDPAKMTGMGDGPLARPLPLPLRHLWLTALALAIVVPGLLSVLVGV